MEWKGKQTKLFMYVFLNIWFETVAESIHDEQPVLQDFNVDKLLVY